MHLRRFVCALLLLSPAAPALAQTAAPRLTFTDLRRVVFVRSPQLSPDGSRIVYVRSRANWKADRYDSALVLADVRSGSSRTLTHDLTGVSAPQWSADGTRIAFLASRSPRGRAQIFVLPMNGGDAEQITKAPEGVQSFSWRPDGAALAYTTADAAPKAVNHLDAVVITDQNYLTEAPSQPVHVWVVDAGGVRATRLTSGPWSVDGKPQWSRDGTAIYYQRQPDAIFAHFVAQTTYVHEVAAKTDRALGLGIDQSPAISTDGAFFAVTTPLHGSLYLQNDVTVFSLPDARRAFSSIGIDRNVHWFGWLPGDKGLAVATSDGVRDVLWIQPRNGAPARLHTGGVDVAPDLSIAKDGGIAFVGSRRDRPNEIYYLAPGSNSAKQITNENAWIDGFASARSVAFPYPTDLGTTAVGVLTYPVGYVPGRKYPLVLDIHGGPVSTSTWTMSGLEGGALVPVLAADGFFVFRPNYRGSDNLGDAFLQAIVGDVTSGPGRDNLAAVAALRATGMIDESRIGVSGWSGGGLQTSWLIGHATFWRAAVSGAAVNDWYQQAVLADINENFAQTFFNGRLPFSKAGKAMYAAESPITYAANVKTPTLILSDTRDQRVPVSQAYTFYHALRDRGVTVRFTAFPRYGHFPTDPVGREQALRAWAGWFERWLR